MTRFSNKANLNHIEDVFGNTTFIRAVIDGNLENVKTLLATGQVDHTHVDVAGDTALILASKRGYLEIVKLLLATGQSNPGHCNNTGDTALILASFRGQFEIVKLLLATCQSNPGHHNNIGDTALMYASMKGDSEIVEVLLATGQTNPMQRSIWGETALMYASDHLEIRKMILKHLVVEKIVYRRRLAFYCTQRWARCMSIGAPGSNQFFYAMGQAFFYEDGLTTLEELRKDYPDATEENHRFYLNYT